MMIILITFWLLLGLLAVFNAFNSLRKNWYEDFNEDYWELNKVGKYSALTILLIGSPILILGGLLSLLIFLAFGFSPFWKYPKDYD